MEPGVFVYFWSLWDCAGLLHFTTFHSDLPPWWRAVWREYRGIFWIYLKAGSAGKAGCFPLFPFPQKVGKNNPMFPHAAVPWAWVSPKCFRLKGQGGGNNAGAGDVSKC